MKQAILYVALISAFFLSFCKKHKEEVAPEEMPAITYNNYSALKVGNYWIYDVYEVDSLGNATPVNVYDSCYVQKDTLINNRTYFKVYRPNYAQGNGFLYVRDSLHYIVDASGMIVFSSLDFSTTFNTFYLLMQPNDTFYVAVSKMEHKDKLISMPAGSFNASDFKTAYTFADFPQGGYMKNRSTVTYYARGIGVVYETLTFFTAYPFQKERRLVRYHIG
ncbi:MAG: hypothetical protein V4506_14075 [Bacteroidota bacterium]